MPLITLGSKYGSWTLLDVPENYGCVLISCGLGEDASFDIEFATRYRARVHMVDPTPRAITHYEQIHAALGSGATSSYVPGGRQPVSAYDLSAIEKEQLGLNVVAVADRHGEAKFFGPPNPNDVSYSLVNFQNGYATDTPHIIVRTIPVEDLFVGLQDRNTILKLDIEGAEIPALARLATSPMRPQQILVEYDELAQPSRLARKKFEGAHQALLSIGYQSVYFDGRTCVSYVRSDIGGRRPRNNRGT